MATTESQVNTVFTVDDKASGSIKQVSENANTLAVSANNAKKAVSGLGGGAGGGGGGEKKGGKKELTAEEQANKAMKEEAMARRMRVKGLKLEEQRGDLVENTMGQLAGAFGANTGVFGQIAGITEQLGFQMSAFGGSLGKTGAKLVGFAGSAGAYAAAFAAGYVVGEKLMDMADWVNGELQLWENDEQKRRKANESYAQSLGYRSAAEYATVTKVMSTMAAEVQLQQKIEEQSKYLAAMPTDRTGKEMENWLNELEASARATGAQGPEFQKAVEGLKAAAEKSAGTWLNEAQEHAKLDSKVKEASKVLAMYVPMVNKTLEEQQKYNAKTAELTQAMVRNGSITSAQGEAMTARLQQEAEAYGNYGNIISGYEQEANLKVRMNAEAERQVKHMKRLPLHATEAQLFEFNRAIAGWTSEAATRLKLTPEQAKEYLGVVKDAAMKKNTALNVNFNNNKFDIKQAFAEGFDPDRIAVAFGNDLAALGERRMQASSGLVPMGSG